ncbi:MAG: cytochrome b/b6 domain-containing protein [Candidatus Caldarchaeum sp.]|nr:cytochrome b/b6 domain-containing protein [Candidatus Caldarchaeum sp.]MDW8436104.1 cytochrome b/b6 domain-containing protein [Candidatus Caldarchaeum sp.]
MKLTRWNRFTRITHWLLFIGVTAGFISGLPVLNGEWFRFLYYVLGGEAGREFIHYYFVTVVLGLAIPFVIYRAASARYEEWWWPSWAEIRQAVQISLRWLGLTKKYPAIGFHHPLEKFYLMLSHVGLILLGASGIPMVFLPIDTSLKAVLLLVHDIGFLMLGVPLVGHFMLSINPVNWEALKSMFYDGKVSVEWASKHHPSWAETQLKKTKVLQK